MDAATAEQNNDSLEVDFITFLAFFSIFVILYYLWKCIDRKAKNTSFQDNHNPIVFKGSITAQSPSKSTEQLPSNISPPIRQTSFTYQPHELYFGGNEADSRTSSASKRRKPKGKQNSLVESFMEEISTVQKVAKRKKAGYGLVDHSVTTAKKQRRILSLEEKKKLNYCPINVESNLSEK